MNLLVSLKSPKGTVLAVAADVGELVADEGDELLTVAADVKDLVSDGESERDGADERRSFVIVVGG